jgi:hypothetical protein
MPYPTLVQVVEQAIDGGCSLGQLEQTLLADGDTVADVAADDMAAVWLYAWAYDAVRPAGHDLAAQIAEGVERAG